MNFEEYLNETTGNLEVMRQFASDDFPKDKKPVWGSNNLKIRKEDNGWSLVNYSTPIAYRENEGSKRVWINKTKYSVTTSKIQNQLRGAFRDQKVIEVEGRELQDIIDDTFELEQEK